MRKAKPEKTAFGRFGRVRLSVVEHEKLLSEFGPEKTALAVDKLDSYLEARGDRYKSHYAAMLNWVFRAVGEDLARGPRPVAASRDGERTFRTFAQQAEDQVWAEFEAKRNAAASRETRENPGYTQK